MSKFIEKVKEIWEKVSTACKTFFSTNAGTFILKVLCMFEVLLLIGGIICIEALAGMAKVGVIPAIAVTLVCIAAIDKIVKAIKIIIQ